MTSLRPRADHQEAISRRLDLLTAELASTRPEEAPGGDPPDEAWLAGHTRIRPLRAVPDHVAEPVPVPAPMPVVPVPGRHAARRTAVPLLPEAVRARIALGPTQLVVVAVLVAIGLAVTGWWVIRGDPEQLEAPTSPTVSSAPLSGAAAPLADAGPAAASPAAAGAAASVTVDVTGRVRRPGIVVLDAGARVVDALDAAGGSRRGVDVSSLNLARVLVDGEQIVVGGPPAPSVGAAAAAGAGSPAGPLVNLNTATQPELEALPEVGPVTAQSILSWRTEHGGFTSVDELLEVDGIGDATLAQIAPHVTI